MPPAPALTALLRFSARIETSAGDRRRLARLAAGVADWHGLPSEAEAHGLAPLMHRHLADAGVTLPPAVRRQLAALAVHHRRANAVYAAVLRDVLDAYADRGIRPLVLKGAALAHLLYPEPGLRPMSDVDLLVDRAQAPHAQAILRELGFDAPSMPPSARLVGHHHLPPAVRTVHGYTVTIEVHHDALSPDSFGSLTTRRLTGLARFPLLGRPAWTLGHHDMLVHLCRHLAERAERLRLLCVADVVEYASRFQHEIDWARLARDAPFVVNALSLLQLLRPLPEGVARHVPPPADASGAGATLKPLASTLRAGRAPADVWRDLFRPSPWWLRLYYGVGADVSLVPYLWCRHPLHVGRWLARRGLTHFLFRAGLAR